MFQNAHTVYEEMLRAVLSGTGGYSYFRDLHTYFVIIGISLIALRFMYAIAKGEIQSMEQFFSFISERGIRFLIAIILLLPAPAYIGNYGLPVAMEVTIQMGHAAFKTGDHFSGMLIPQSGGSMTKMPLVFQQVLQQKEQILRTANAEASQRAQTINEVTSKKSAAAGSGGFWSDVAGFLGSAYDRAMSVGGYISAATDIPSLISNILHHFVALASGALDALFDFIANIVIFVSMTTIIYGLIIITAIHFIVLAPIFYLSTLLLFFDRKKDQVFNNFISLITIMFRPLGIVLAFYIITVAYNIFNFLTDTAYMHILSNQSNVSMFYLIILALVSAFGFIGIAGAILKNVQLFFSNMIGTNISFGLSSTVR